MMLLSSRTLAAAFASIMLVGAAVAQTPTPASPVAPAAKTAPTKETTAKAKTERTAVSLDCSKQADAKGLHGDERRKFRSSCKKSAGKTN